MTWHLAQINIARLVAGKADAQVAGFFDALDRINAAADAAPGFVWRMQGEGGNATAMQPTADDRLIVNISMWTSPEALFDYVYRSAHTPVMAKRRDWFERFDGAYQALWWVASGHRPTIDEGLARLWHLDRYGATAHAFGFKTRFAAPPAPGAPTDMQPDPWCVGWS